VDLGAHRRAVRLLALLVVSIGLLVVGFCGKQQPPGRSTNNHMANPLRKVDFAPFCLLINPCPLVLISPDCLAQIFLFRRIDFNPLSWSLERIGLGCLHVFLVVLMAVPLAFSSDVFFHIHALGLGRSTAGSWPPCAFPLPPVGGPLAVPGRAYRWHVSCWCVRLRWGSSARVSGHDSSAIQSLQFLLRRRRPVFSCALLLDWFHLLRRRPGVVCEASGGSAASPPWWQPDWLTVGESTPVQRRRHVEATHDVDDATRKRSDDTQGSVKRRLVCVFLMDFDVMPCSTRVVSAFRTFLS
jgi:hypothetical protein